MTSKLDPQELERLLTRYEELVGRHYRGTLEVRGQAEKYEADLRLASDLRDKLRTGQLVPAMPSGDVVEAVARAIMVAKGGKCLVEDWSIERRDNPHVALAWDQATAAITAYEAVSGVAKMREALEGYRDDVQCDLCERTISSGAAARAALGEKP